VTLTYDKLQLEWVRVNHLPEHLGQRSFLSKVIIKTHWFAHSGQGRIQGGYKRIYASKIVMYSTSNGQENKCNKFPTGWIY